MTRVAYDVAKNDRADLEGNVVDYVYRDGSIVKAVVVGCNRAVGFTLVQESNKKYLICVRGPVTSDPSVFNKYAECTYDEHYDAFVHMVQEGSVIPSELIQQKHGAGGTYGQCNGNCAYGQ